ncbi:NAD(P)/FAD-dependent oxidoreductase [uncultured Aeromicrobium sp.]|uniref:flavin-containing monooxygenase n=1 Tax=uncultured Aeromicrobium sp. TaxID=337820 RepID=UPI0025E83216|nr:NAD(P)/FAD-dependent oxidoreductase [uncultured Aeromicrobium sp.]
MTLPLVSVDQIEELLAGAEIPPLLAAMAHATGDRDFLDPGVAPPHRQRGARLVKHGGMDELAVERAKELIAAALPDVLGREPALREELIEPSLSFLAGRLRDGADDLLRHELVGPPPPVDLTASGLRAVVVGAGVSGLAAAVNLRAAGVEVTVLDKNEEVGGTWWENTYPGCRLDTPNFTYSYSFAQRPVWPDHFSQQPDLRDYLIEVSSRFRLRDAVRFGREVEEAVWEEPTAEWVVTVQAPHGKEVYRCDVLVTAVGQLNRPRIPDIPGLDEFPGDVMHSATWDHDVDLVGREVAVVGTGASAFQIVPAVVDDVARLTVFQRNAPWMLPTPHYTQPIDGSQRTLFERVPGYGRWYRFWQFVASMEAWLPLVEVDPQWSEPGSVSRLNAQFREELLDALRSQFADRPDLLDICTPHYPPGAKRMLRDDGSWGRALRRDHVDVVRSGVVRICGRRLIAADNSSAAADVIVFATGFRAEEFLAPMRIVGRGGQTLSDHWKGDARAYATTSVPGFPNLFMMLGPNSGLAANGSIVFMSECAAEYVVRCLEVMVRRQAVAMEPTPAAYERFSERIDAANRRRAWGIPGVSTWYQNQYGRVSQNWPLELADYWELTHRVVEEDFDFTDGR